MINLDEIEKAIAAHEQWKEHFKEVIESKSTYFDIPAESIRKDDQCDFGKWINGPTFSGDDKTLYYSIAARELHAEFHLVAAYVVMLALSNRKAEALKIMAIGGEFAMISEKLMNTMMRWKDGLRELERMPNYTSYLMV